MKLKRVLPIILVLGLLLSMMPLSVAAATSVTITKQPESTVAQKGDLFKFTVVAKGDGLKYEWYIKDTGGQSYSKSSIQKATYSAEMNDTRDGRTAYCVVTDQYGNQVKSNVVKATMAVTITKQPQNTTTSLGGGTFSFTVKAKGDGLKYQWYVKDVTSKSYSKSKITTKTYTSTMTDARDGRKVYCVVTDQYGNKVKSDVAQVTKTFPEITKQPKDCESDLHGPAQVSLKATGDGLTYTWYVLKPDAEEYVKSSITKSKYAFAISTEDIGRKVYCVVTDRHGQSVTSDVAEFKAMKPKVYTQPQDQYAYTGDLVKMDIYVSYAGFSPRYEWYVKAVGAEEFVPDDSSSNSLYQFKMSREMIGTQVYCVVTDQFGESVQTDVATVYYGKPKFTTQPKSADCRNGETVSVTAKAKGLDVTYQWYYKNAGTKKFYKSSVSGDTYSYKMTSAKSGRQVYCVATDVYGNTVQSKTVTLRISAPEITVQPQNDTAKYGATVSASVKAIGDGLKYQWYFCNPSDNVFYKSSNKTATYSYTMTAEKNGRKAYCLITDKYGQKVQSKTVTFKKNTTLKITQQPVEAVAYIGDAASVTVKAQGDGLKYQWYFCNPGDTVFRKSSVTTATYSFEMTFEKTGRKVYCVVTDKHGDSVQSKTVVMRTIRPKITMQPTVVHDVYNKDLYVVVDAQGYEMTCEWYICEVGSSTFKKSSITGPIYYTDYTDDVIGRRIYCIVTDCFGYSATSDTIVLDPGQTEFIPMYE